MRIASIAILLASLVTAASSSLRAADNPRPALAKETRQNASLAVDTYCAGCHNGTMRSPSGALLDRFDGAAIGDNRDAWSRAYRQVQAGTMPPVGARRPDRHTADALLASIETALGADRPLPADATSQEIGERLASLLWNSTPDAALLDDVRRDRLTSPANLERQIQRMLADDRAEAFVSRFFVPWLGLDKLAKAEPNKAYFPGFTSSLRDDMATETDLFLRSQLREDRDPIELWNADYTFLNEELARHYGVTGVSGSSFRRVSLQSPERHGLLGQGSILMITSRHQQGTSAPYTSPASRSTWVERHFLGAQPPQPFPGALPVKPGLPITPQVRALAVNPCVNCHRNFFPLGYALENFDAVGRWRTRDEAGPVDASGALVDGTPTNGVVQLRDALLQYPEAFRTTVAEKLVAYASGEPPNTARPVPETLVRARQVLHAAAPVRWSSLIAAAVRATPLP